MLMSRFNEKIAQRIEARQYWDEIRMQEMHELESIERLRDSEKSRICVECYAIRSPYEASIGICDGCGFDSKYSEMHEAILGAASRCREEIA